MINYLAGVILFVIILTALYFSDDKNYCKLAEAEMEAMAACISDTHCFRSPGDWQEVFFWKEVNKEYCQGKEE